MIRLVYRLVIVEFCIMIRNATGLALYWTRRLDDKSFAGWEKIYPFTLPFISIS